MNRRMCARGTERKDRGTKFDSSRITGCNRDATQMLYDITECTLALPGVQIRLFLSEAGVLEY